MWCVYGIHCTWIKTNDSTLCSFYGVIFFIWISIFLLLFDTDKCLLISTLLEQSTVSLHFAMRKIKSSIICINSLWALYIDIRFAVGKAWWMNAQWRFNINVISIYCSFLTIELISRASSEDDSWPQWISCNFDKVVIDFVKVNKTMTFFKYEITISNIK